MYRPSLLTILETNDLSLANNAAGTDKEHPKRYISFVYGPLLESVLRRDLKVLEIGVRSGASLKLWSEFFTSGDITGIDDLSSHSVMRDEWISGPRSRVRVGNAYSENFLNQFADDFDLVIDDGPHSLESQIWAASNWSRKLRLGGHLVIEDIQGGWSSVIQIVNSVPRNEGFCVRVADLRDCSSQSDALLVIVHRCLANCDSPLALVYEEVSQDSIVYRLFLRISILKSKLGKRLVGWNR